MGSVTQKGLREGGKRLWPLEKLGKATHKPGRQRELDCRLS